MNLYFVVEGKIEAKVYPDWLSYLLPQLSRVTKYSQAQTNNYFLISGRGYPTLYDIVEAAVEEINLSRNYDYPVICLDAEENTVNDIQQEILAELFINRRFPLGKTDLKIVVQNRCIETWLLGNQKIYSRQPQSQLLLDYTNYYNVSTDYPELMGKYNYSVHAQFHEAYLKELLSAKIGHILKQYLETLRKNIISEHCRIESIES